MAKLKPTFRNYKCPWCQYEFTQGVRKVTGVNGSTRASVSDQVKCRKCGNFLKTWD